MTQNPFAHPCRPKRRGLVAGMAGMAGMVFAAAAFGVSAEAWAVDFAFRLNNQLQTHQGQPSITLMASESATDVELVLERSDGNTSRVRVGKLKGGEEKLVPLKQPKGKFSYEATILSKNLAGEDFSTQITFDVAWVDAIEVKVDRDRVDLEKGLIPFASNRPVQKVELELMDEKGNPLGQSSHAFDGRQGALELRWDPAIKAGALRMTVHDVAGFWAAVLLEPFFVEIPHQEVIFDFGKASWQPSEEPKLKATLESVRKAMAEHAHKGLEMQLYIAGYTDTVGPAESNLRLSQERAQAIARWFARNGLEIALFHQGFGESALAVATPDDTPEERNRRVVYVLGNARPPLSAAFPRADWKQAR